MPSEGVLIGFLCSAGDVEYAVGADVVECAAVYYEEAVGRNVLCERTQPLRPYKRAVETK